jgi:hypothetical protein
VPVETKASFSLLTVGLLANRQRHFASAAGPSVFIA